MLPKGCGKEVCVHMPSSVICPRCGQEGYLYRKDTQHNVYNYCRHVTWEGGKRRERKCYLGPDRYINVEKLHNIDLAGCLDHERWFRYAEEAIFQLNREQLLRLREIIENRLRKLEEEQEMQLPEEIDAVAEWERAAQKESLEVAE
jgi:predicted  nucleic acid-binding Zn-ribbon protein